MVSLLDGRATVTVMVPKLEPDEWGTYTKTGETPVEVACSPQWLRPGQSGDLATAPGTSIIVVARVWPGVPGCRFQWGGDWFEQVGPAKRLYGSPNTSHVEVLARLIEMETP